MRKPLTILAALAACTLAARAEQPVAVYVHDAEGARLVTPAGADLAPGAAVTVFLADLETDETARAAAAVGARAEPTAADLERFEAPAVWALEPLPGESPFGIAVIGLEDGAAPDVDGNGVVEVPVICTATESVQLALVEGEGQAMRLAWYMPVWLGWDVEPSCSEAFFAAVEGSM